MFHLIGYYFLNYIITRISDSFQITLFIIQVLILAPVLIACKDNEDLIEPHISYLIFYYVSNNIIYKHLSKKTMKKVDKAIDKFQNISLSNLTVIITLPFTPAFLINILAGVSGMRKKKFLLAILIGKIFMISFWGYIGKSLVESMTDITTIIIMSIMIVIAYILSKIIGKKANIE